MTVTIVHHLCTCGYVNIEGFNDDAALQAALRSDYECPQCCEVLTKQHANEDSDAVDRAYIESELLDLRDHL